MQIRSSRFNYPHGPIRRRVRVVQEGLGVPVGEEGVITDWYDESDREGWAKVFWVEFDGGQRLDFRMLYLTKDWPGWDIPLDDFRFPGLELV